MSNVDHGGDGDANEEKVERSHHVRHIWVRHVETLTFKSIEVISGQGIYYQIGVSMLMVDVISGQATLSLALKCNYVISGKVNYVLTLISYPGRLFLLIQSLLRCCFLPG